MDESERVSEEGFVSISEAAGALGISERQARRYAGRLDATDRREAGHHAGRASGVTVSLAAMRAARELVTGEGATDTTPDVRPDVRPDTKTPQAGHEPDAVVVDDLRDQVKFLRGAVEQHQRAEAELRAALRTALSAMPKALPEGQANQPTPESQQAPETAPEATPAVATPVYTPPTFRRDGKGLRGILLRLLK